MLGPGCTHHPTLLGVLVSRKGLEGGEHVCLSGALSVLFAWSRGSPEEGSVQKIWLGGRGGAGPMDE